MFCISIASNEGFDALAFSCDYIIFQNALFAFIDSRMDVFTDLPIVWNTWDGFSKPKLVLPLPLN